MLVDVASPMPEAARGSVGDVESGAFAKYDRPGIMDADRKFELRDAIALRRLNEVLEKCGVDACAPHFRAHIDHDQVRTVRDFAVWLKQPSHQGNRVVTVKSYISRAICKAPQDRGIVK